MITPDNQDIDCGDRHASLGGYVLDRSSIKEQVRQLSKINNLKAAWTIFLQWLIIIAAVLTVVGTFYLFTGHFALIRGLVQLSPSQFIILLSVYLLAALIIATRQHAMGVIMHDTAHYRLFTHRGANDMICNIFCGFPNGFAISRYRRIHLAHHRFINTDKDPDWQHIKEGGAEWHWPKSKADAIMVFLGDFSGWNMFRMGKLTATWSPLPVLFNFNESKASLTSLERWSFITFWLLIAFVLTWTQTWLYFFLIWLIPQLTIVNGTARVRMISEHIGLEDNNELTQSRHVEGNWWEKMCLSPLNSNFHLAHHLFPAVPLYNLPKLHDLLMSDPVYRTKAKIYPNYLSLKNGALADLVL